MKNDESIHFSIDILYTCTDNKCKVYIFWISKIKRNRKAKIFWRQLIIYETDQLNSLTEQSSDPSGWVSSKLDWSTALREAIVSQQAWPHPLSVASDGQAGRSRYCSPLPSTAGHKRLKIHQHQTQLCGTVPFCLYCHTFTRALCSNAQVLQYPSKLFSTILQQSMDAVFTNVSLRVIPYIHDTWWIVWGKRHRWNIKLSSSSIFTVAKLCLLFSPSL